MIPNVRMIGIALAFTAILGALYGVYSAGYRNGNNAGLKSGRDAVYSMQNALTKANQKAIDLERKQKKSYVNALNVRNQNYDTISVELQSRLQEIENLKTDDSCVKKIIPKGLR